MLSRFKEKGYPKDCLESAMATANQIDRKELFQKRERNKTPPSVNYVLTYDPFSAIIKSTVLKHWHILSSDKTLNDRFQLPPRFTHKRATSLRDRFVKADTYSRPDPVITGNFPCRSCTSCSHMVKTNNFHDSHTGKNYKIKSLITCNSSNLIYLLFCPCKKYYVGQTSRKLKIRLTEHRSNIKRADVNSPVARHFNEMNHKISDLKCIGLEIVQLNRHGGNHKQKLLQRECIYIHRLQSTFPRGMNEDFSLAPFL